MGAETYAPSKISISVSGHIITGYAEDTFVTIAHASDTFTKKVGADGRVSRTHSADNSGTIILTLKQTSSSNDVLSALHLADKLTLNAKFPVLVTDSNGTSKYIAGDAWIMKIPEAGYAQDEGTREWTIECSDLVSFVGSNT